MTRSTAIAVAGVVALVAGGAALQWRARDHITRGGFWFDDAMTFDVPHLRAAGFGAPISTDEKALITSLARSELQAAFSGYRFELSERHDAPYTVHVIQEFPPSRMARFGAAGQSIVLAPLGGYGEVSLLTVSSLAVSYAPPGATREEIIAGIGRGIGRAAVHEFAHQLLPQVQIHASTDARSYEFEVAGRPAGFYGSIHWDLARPSLERRLGRDGR